MLGIFSKANYRLTLNELKPYLAKEDAKDYVLMPDYLLNIFLDGLIIEKRGKKEGEEELSQKERVALAKSQKLTNNLILKKMKIALQLTTDDIVLILKSAKFRVSKSELGALFRNPDHRNYRECGNQFMRNFLTGLTNKPEFWIRKTTQHVYFNSSQR